MIVTTWLLSTRLLYAHERAEEPRLVEATSCFLSVCFLGFIFQLTEGQRVSMSNDGCIQVDCDDSRRNHVLEDIGLA